MSEYVDGFVLPVRRDRLEEYKEVAKMAAEIWKEHGALEYWECVGEDLRVEGVRSFLDMADVGEEEVVIFSWVVFASREVRDAANEKIQSDPRMAEIMDLDNPPFDVQRMAFGGFQTIVQPSRAE